MLRSMTGFGRASAEYADKTVTVEIRSVNSRYLDFTMKSPRSYAVLEPRIKQLLQEKAAVRGKVELSLSVEHRGGDGEAITVDKEYTAAYLAALRDLQKTFRLRNDISVMRVAENREVFTVKRIEADPEAEWNEILPVVSAAMDAFRKAKTEEGERTARDFGEKLARIKEAVARVGTLSESDKSSYHDRLEARLRQALADQRITVDEQRILTECAIFADKVAVDEEIARLGSHFEAFDAILLSDEPAGRRLDFLMQEMNRETNTIGSKCNNAEIARIVVDIKCELEKIREQVQNVE